MENEYSAIYLIGNSETNHIFEYVGKVAITSAIGYFTIKGMQRVAKSKEVKNMIDKIKSR